MTGTFVLIDMGGTFAMLPFLARSHRRYLSFGPSDGLSSLSF